MTAPRPIGKVKIGIAIADNLEGPFIIQSEPITTNGRALEDGYAFIYKGKIALLTTVNQYTNIAMEEVAVHYGPQNSDYVRFERPQLFLKNGKPSYLYAPSGKNIYGVGCTISYVLKFKN